MDGRDIKARLELDTVRYLLVSAEDTIPSESFLGGMEGERKTKSVRVAVECSIFWQLREFGSDFFSIQDLLGTVWDILDKMESVKISDPVEFAEYFNSNRDFAIAREAHPIPLPYVPSTTQASLQQSIPGSTPRPSLPYVTTTSTAPSRQTILFQAPRPDFSLRPPIIVRPRPTPITLPTVRLPIIPTPQSTAVSQPNASTQAAPSSQHRETSSVLAMMNREVLCKICLDQPADVVLIPCGHFLSCSSCFISLTHCPICRKEIRGSIRPSFA